MEQQEKTEFVSAYTKLLTTAWSDEEFAQLLARDPKQASRDCGLEVPNDAEMVVVRDPQQDAEPNLDLQIESWEKGHELGLYELHVPDAPQLDSQELSEGDLMAVSGGDTYCCCCPCCCCT